MNVDVVEPAVIAIIQRLRTNRKPISRSAALLHDLHIAGDDANELLEEIAKRFGVSFAGFKFAAYFPNETEALTSFWASKLGHGYKQRRLSVGHLLAVIERGAWFEPEAFS